MSGGLLEPSPREVARPLSCGELLGLASADLAGRGNRQRKRSIRHLLRPMICDVLAARCWRAESIGMWKTGDDRYWMPRLIFSAPGDDEPRIKVAIFAGIHGDEPGGVYALGDLVRALDAVPAIARQFALHLYPLCNPTGFEDRTRHSRSGKDLNREFWRGSPEPEVALIERVLRRENYDGLISLHSDDTSEGLYGFVRGATLAEHLLKPAFARAEQLLPVNQRPVIDGFHAVNGIIHSVYDGILSAPRGVLPAPFEIILEAPAEAPLALQRAALLLTVSEILTHYREMIAFRADL